MKKIAVIILIAFFVGCNQVPSVLVQKPWNRSIKANQIIEPTKNIKIEVIGTTLPLVGSEQLTAEQLRSYLTQLITRRGFIIENDKYEYLAKLSYKTEKSSRTVAYSSLSSISSQTYSTSVTSGMGISQNFGVNIAQAVSSLKSNTRVTTTQITEEIEFYVHTIAIELSNRDGALLWKGESTWNSAEPDILNRITFNLQLLLSNLPSDKAVRPEIPEVKDTHVDNYYRLQCKGYYFTCPALPFRILFNREGEAQFNLFTKEKVKNKNALAAYIDLIQTAEYALPNGNEKNWKNPLEMSLWEKVTLGGQYYLGPDKTPVNVIIQLQGKQEGYYIDECKIATAEEFSDFSNNMDKWREVLSNYFDMYKK